MSPGPPLPFRTLLVANRGEIALRVFGSAKELGLTTVAIHTELDAAAPHVRAADVAVPVPSYLDIDAVVAAARGAGADAIHPGYGFLSERAEFVRAVDAAGITFVGPSAEVMEQMGRKDAAREIAVAAGVPVVPTGEDAGYPVLVKAAAGGGGKGMRIVRAAEEYDEAVAAARREAASAFGDDTILVEKYVERGRHIEVQVLGDTHGTVVHLGTRDCSAQRRHQKVLEEAPAPGLDPHLRQRIHQAAVDLARGVGYTNAGTVEFLLDTDTGEFYFLEMNTRLQVEHPVTELVCGGIDLVAQQLWVAGGGELGIEGTISPHGHAIEARVYAEDSFGGFLPQAGTATQVHWPSSVRVDHALESGQTVSTAYDPMLGKVVAHGPDRESARQALVAALDDTAILGLTTNAGFLRALVASDEFRDGAIDTAWLDRHDVPAPDPAPARELAAWEVFLGDREEAGPFASDGFRLGAEPAPVVVELDEPVTLTAPPLRRAVAAVRHDRVEVVHQGQRFVFDRPDVMADHGAAVGDGTILAPMPGTVIDVRVEEGQQVEEGDVLGVMEAMKMELSMKAPFAGRVAAVGATTGAQVALGHPLFTVEAVE
jgi:acetyl-CoA/propionyl-CoA carboxylase biotin carboxyl carrier protein